MPSLAPTEPDQVVRASCSLSLEQWPEILKFCFHPISQSGQLFAYACQLSAKVHTRWPQGALTELLCSGEICTAVRVPRGQQRRVHRWGMHSGSWAGLWMELMKQLVGPFDEFQALAAVLRASSSPSSIHITYITSAFWMWCKGSGPLGQCPAQLGEPGTLSHSVIFPHGKNHRSKESLLILSCAPAWQWWHG